MTTPRTGGSCLPSYRTQSTLALSEPQDHVRELADWAEHASAVAGVPGAQEVWDNAYKWLRLAQGLRSMTFDMSYDDGGMCSVGGDFDAVWTEMMEEWQLHQVRLGYLRAALEGFVRLLHPDAAHPGLAIEAAEQLLQHQAEALPVHARAVAEHLGTHCPDHAGGSDAPVATGVAQAIALHEKAVHGRAGIPEPTNDADMNVFAAGHAEVCAAREAATVLLLGIQVLMAAAVKKDRVAAFDDKYLLDGMWIPDASGDSRWVDEEMPYGEYLAVLHLAPGEPPEL
ncbi:MULTISPECIES: hypothetical protein [Streptomyces]|uniref:Uncharacterized protein n=2 Tax=Streptomyces malaysiensis TaxID=92644 RepID=A0A2J7YW91_STRMQ|nr:MULTISPECIES: hypothetical protein [Streptomyces]PNG92298.1 hypothetical protein SMF913_27763 [Streptomyces malaysiensis]QPI59096.1 hypothetical protein I1A49_33070 [Streptomyces solisilvae]UHH20740.1 hypothetical protein LUV23_33290 [Streptomyces sp. HNM0561]